MDFCFTFFLIKGGELRKIKKDIKVEVPFSKNKVHPKECSLSGSHAVFLSLNLHAPEKEKKKTRKNEQFLVISSPTLF